MSHVIIYFISRVFVNYVIMDGLLFVKIEEKHTVELLIMFHLKSYKEPSMIIQLIYGA